MKAALAAAMLAGCYAPNAPVGITCDPAQPVCPRGQSCVPGTTGYSCQIASGGGGFDAPIDAPIDEPTSDTSMADAPMADAPPTDGPASDAPAAVDTDGDGVKDTVDNCPTVANAAQYNEDGDRFGDVCDPCPPVADNAPPDGDGDGVADACDPRPSTGGDTLVLFEGFGGGVPATWTKTGTWTASNGSVTGDGTAGGGAKLMLLAPSPTTSTYTVSTSMLLQATVPNVDVAAGLIESYDTTARTGVYCHVTAWSATNTPVALNRVSASGTVLDTSAFDITPGTTYAVSERRDGTSRTCRITHGAAAATATGTAPESPTTPVAGARLIRTKATFAWLMIVANN